MNRTISKAEFHRRCKGVSKQYVYRQFKEGGKLEDALINGKVDLGHPDAAYFCAQHGYEEPDGATIAASVRKTAVKKRPTPKPNPRKPEPVAPLGGDQLRGGIDLALMDSDPDVEDDLGASEILEMPLGEVIARYGTATRLREYAAVVKSLVQTRGYEDDQARKRGEYIHRVHAERLIDHIESLHKALLTDAVTNVITTLQAQIKSGASRIELEKTLHNTISRTIKITKEQSARNLRNA